MTLCTWHVPLLTTTLLLFLSACGGPSQNTYSSTDVGTNTNIVFGTVLSKRTVNVKDAEAGGAGIVGGGTVGAVAGSALSNGGLFGSLLGAGIGAVGGGLASEAASTRDGIEYVISIAGTNKAQSIVQNIAKDDQPISVGQCVMLQIGNKGEYRRVLPAPPNTPQCTPPKPHKHRKHKHIDDDDQ